MKKPMLFDVVDALWGEKIKDRSPPVGKWYSVDDERLESLREIKINPQHSCGADAI